VTRAPERLTTDRLLLRRPQAGDAAAIFARYASDREVTRHMSFPVHVSLDDTRAFLALCDESWSRWPAGAYLAFSRADGRLLGSTGLHFETADEAATGYVFARDAWGRGYATESLRAMVELAGTIGLRRLHAICHPDHRASAHVLEKCGFVLEGARPPTVFPNFAPGPPCEALCYARVF